MGDTPWFIQKQRIEDVRMLMDDRKALGFNTLFLEILDDSHIPSIDGYGHHAFATDTDITRPLEPFWNYAEQLLDEAAGRGFFVILSELWYGAGPGLWMHHVTPENARVYGEFIGKRLARFQNLMWMQAGDRNPDARLAECTRILARQIRAAAPHQLQTVHNSPESASAVFHHQDDWLDVNLGYTYGMSYLHILPEYHRKDPVRPLFLGETGYEDEPNDITRLPDAKQGDLWNPYRIRRNAWWAVTSGACGYCAGTRLWRWEPNWREILHIRSIREAPLILKIVERLPWTKLVPDDAHRFVTAGYGTWKQADYATAAIAEDGSAAIAYLPSPREITIDPGKLAGPAKAEWTDPTSGAPKPAQGHPAEGGKLTFSPPGPNAAGEPDWLLVLDAR